MAVSCRALNGSAQSKVLIDDQENVQLVDTGLATITRPDRQASDNGWRWRDLELIVEEATKDNAMVLDKTTDVFAFGMTVVEVRLLR